MTSVRHSPQTRQLFTQPLTFFPIESMYIVTLTFTHPTVKSFSLSKGGEWRFKSLHFTGNT